jgi:hypothetical protein
MSRCVLVALLGALVATPAAAARPELVPVEAQGSRLMAPRGWAVRSQAAPVTSIELAERPGDPASPSVLLMSLPLQGGPQSPATAVAAVLASIEGRHLVRRGTGPNGAAVAIWDGTLSGVRGRVAVLEWSQPAANLGLVAVLAAPPDRFEALGGVDLLYAVLGVGAPPAAPVAKGSAPPASRARLDVPAAYRGSSVATLYFVADTLWARSPAELAAALRASNADERQLLGVYSAFANLLHGIACGADASLVLGGQDCRATLTRWAETLRLTGGDRRRALDYAERQRETFLIGERCTKGRLSKSACSSYVRQRRADLDRHHATMTRVIAHLGNGCIIGDPDCPPY